MDGSAYAEGLTEEYLRQVHAAFSAYEESGDVFARARLVRDIGKTHAPALLREVERLRDENLRLRALLWTLLGKMDAEGDRDPGQALADLRGRLTEREWSLLVLATRQD